MNRLVSTLAVAALIALPAAAQFGHFPSNTPNTGSANAWPLYFSSTTGRFLQFLDPARSDLPTGTPLKIVDVAWANASANTLISTFTCSADFQMRMSHLSSTSPYAGGVPSTTYAVDQPACPTNLIDRTAGFTYAAPAQGVWQDFGTDCDFGWDGKSIILLEVRYRGRQTSLGIIGVADSSIARVWSDSTSTDNYAATTAALASASLGLKTRVTYVTDHICLVPDRTQIGVGSPVTLAGFIPGESYQILASLGQTPFGIGNRLLCLSLDSVFFASIFVGPPVFVGYGGIADANGNGGGRFIPPAITGLVGLCVYHAAIGIDTSGVSFTNTAGTELVP